MSDNSLNNSNKINSSNSFTDQDNTNNIDDIEETNNIEDDLSDDVIEALGINKGINNGNKNYDDWVSEEEEAALQDLEELEKIDSLV